MAINHNQQRSAQERSFIMILDAWIGGFARRRNLPDTAPQARYQLANVTVWLFAVENKWPICQWAFVTCLLLARSGSCESGRRTSYCPLVTDHRIDQNRNSYLLRARSTRRRRGRGSGGFDRRSVAGRVESRILGHRARDAPSSPASIRYANPSWVKRSRRSIRRSRESPPYRISNAGRPMRLSGTPSRG